MNQDSQHHQKLASLLRLAHVVCCFLLLLAALVLAACTEGEAVTTEVTWTPLPSATPQPPAPTPFPEGTTTGARIRARGYLLVGIRYDLQPFGYVTGEGEVAGFGVDVGRELARRWLGDAQAVEFRQVRSDTAIERLQAGDVDIVITALTHTQDREAGADFGQPYFMDGQALLVRAVDAGAIGGPLDVQGRVVGVVAWDDPKDALRGAVPFTLTLQSYDRFDAAVAGLGRGDVDVVADLRRRLFWGQRMLPEAVVVGQYTSEPVALAFSQNDPFFSDLVNLTFQDMVTDGTYEELYVRWFAPDLPPAVERWPGEQVPSLADAPFVASVPNTIAAIEARGRLVVAMPVDRSPLAYVGVAGAPNGYEVNLVQWMAGRWLGDVTAVEFITTTREVGKEMLRAGQVDLLLGGLAHTRAAEMEMDFSLTTYVAGEGLMIWAGAPITDVMDLNGQAVAVVEGSGSQETLLMLAQERSFGLSVVPRPTLESAVMLMEGGYAEAVAGDRIDLLGLTYVRPDLDVLPLRLTQVPLALGLPAGDSAFCDLVNLTLQTMKVEGEFDALYTAWFGEAPPELPVWPGVPYRPLQLKIAAPPPEG